jgi:hypothetical protein
VSANDKLEATHGRVPEAVEIRGWSTEREARFKYAGTPAWLPERVPPGRCAHIGRGVWLTRCHECDYSVAHYGCIPFYATVGPHEVEMHGAQVPGINVGMLP